ncbi:hypothetical protein ACPEIF_03275 [Streptomyces sp. NPDC012600]|uniref:hypothetical protein n=1 Tax=Streptomyces sp. NPDC012600 TaxID=3415005 RepID=UPI003C30D285
MNAPSSSMFASVRRHFDEPQVREGVYLTVPADGNGTEPIRLTAAEAHEALYGPAADPGLSPAIWEGVLSAALADRTPYGTGKLLLVWLALPRLTGTVHRVCTRLRADRSDVEAEMVLALLEGLADLDAASPFHSSSLIHTARTRAWRFARAGLREIPSTRVERITQDRAVIPVDGTADEPATGEGLDVRVDRPDGPDGLRASLRFRVRPEHLREEVFGYAEYGGMDRTTRHVPRKRRTRRRVGTLPMRRIGRRP